MLITVAVLTFSSLVYFAEKEEQNWTYVESFWWGLLTITTVGYGKSNTFFSTNIDKVEPEYQNPAYAGILRVSTLDFEHLFCLLRYQHSIVRHGSADRRILCRVWSLYHRPSGPYHCQQLFKLLQKQIVAWWGCHEETWTPCPRQSKQQGCPDSSVNLRFSKNNRLKKHQFFSGRKRSHYRIKLRSTKSIIQEKKN